MECGLFSAADEGFEPCEGAELGKAERFPAKHARPRERPQRTAARSGASSPLLSAIDARSPCRSPGSGFFCNEREIQNPHSASPKTCTRASKSGRKTAIRDARVHVLRSRGCTDVGSRHISPKPGRSGAPHAPHARERAQRRTHHANARERAQRCSPKAATTPPPQQGRKRRRPRFPLFRNPQREDIGTRGSGASAGNERPMRP